MIKEMTTMGKWSSLRLGVVAAMLAMAATLCLAQAASAEFGIAAWDGTVPSFQGGAPFTQAGGHPYELATDIEFNSHASNFIVPDASPKDVLVDLPAGLDGNPTAVSTCTDDQLEAGKFTAKCPLASIIGVAYVDIGLSDALGVPAVSTPIFNMVPPVGLPARFAFKVLGVPIVMAAKLRTKPTVHVGVDVTNISQAVPLDGTEVIFWGVPGDPSHDGDRCNEIGVLVLQTASRSQLCTGVPGDPIEGPNAVGTPPVPFLNLPTSCTAPGVGLEYDVAVDSWDEPGLFDTASFFSHEPAPNTVIQRGVEGCDVVPSNSSIVVQPTSHLASTPSGLNVSLHVPTDGLLNPTGVAQANLKRVTVTLPEGMSVNPSAGAGLDDCTPAEYASEDIESTPDTGCPASSKLGGVSVQTPLLHEPLSGNLYLAEPDNTATSAPGAENPFDSLLALYIVIKDPVQGVLIKQAGKVTSDPSTGQLTATFDDLPQVPFSDFTLSFREGQRSPLVTPPACGTYSTQAEFVPWSAADPSNPAPSEIVHTSTTFDVTQGVGGGACPTGGLAPFNPQMDAGTLNNNAGSYSPFTLRITRNDGEQEITSFSSDLPPGLVANLSGIPFCPDTAIEAARSRAGIQENAEPTCPGASEIGHTLVGAGVGGVLVYVPGKIYMAGPYHGSALSIVSITSATVGPFDLGTVVVRFALRIDKSTAQVHVDAAGSDPIPHILDGIPAHVRDIRVYVDRNQFTLNPTSCDPMSIAATVAGSGATFATLTDDFPVGVGEPFQVSNCTRLGFKPNFKVSTAGRTSRAKGASLDVKLVYPKGAQANIAKVKVDLPRQLPSRLTTLQKACPAATFDADPASCPAASRIGTATAVTPILPVKLSGPVYFVSHGGEAFPNLVVVLQGYGVTVNLVGDTFISKGGITSSTFKRVPDVPINSFELKLPQGPNSALAANGNLCTSTLRMPTAFTAQNGVVIHQSTRIATTGCPKHKAKKAKHHKKSKHSKKR